MCDTTKSWVGASMEDIYNGIGPWGYETSPVNANRHHAVLYELPVNLKQPPKPHKNIQVHHWDNDHVRMPYSPQNVITVKKENGENSSQECWSLIETALLQPIPSSRKLEAVIGSYNLRLPSFLGLHNLFEKLVEEEESTYFFSGLLPKIIGLALRLPEILPGSLPLLKHGSNKSISLSQLQVASLLANAFLCTFPWHKEDNPTYCGVNFVKLFAAHLRPKREQAVAEKLKSICHYFRRVTDGNPVGTITFERKSIPNGQLPNWSENDRYLSETKLHITSKGFIEDDGLGLLQVDFANKNVGGGVLGFGCVQEEIRFIICPELIISRLFTEQLGPTEALIITGAERYSSYDGYGDTFMWKGDYKDCTPRDVWGRRRTTVVAMDALRFGKTIEQYTTSAMLRELNKAYAGFHSHLKHQLPAVATGNWGCGAFRGDAKLKGLLQLMSCSATKRDLVYYTFENDELRDDLFGMYSFLISQEVKVSQLWKYLVKFSNRKRIKADDLYPYIQQAHLDSKNKPSLKTFFGNITLKKNDRNEPSTSAISIDVESEHKTVDLLDEVIIESSQSSEDIIESSQLSDIFIQSSPEIIESSQPEITPIVKNHYKPDVKEQNEILHMFDVIDGDIGGTDAGKYKVESSDNTMIEQMDTSEPVVSRLERTPKRKITDYFRKDNER